MDGLIKTLIGSTARHIGTALATYLLTEGVITASQTESVIGCVCFAATVGYAWFTHWKSAKKNDAAVMTAAITGQIPAPK